MKDSVFLRKDQNDMVIRFAFIFYINLGRLKVNNAAL